MPRLRGRVVLKVLAHTGAIVLLFMAFSFTLFLGLQVSSVYGNIGLVLFAGLVGIYIYFSFVRKRKK